MMIPFLNLGAAYRETKAEVDPAIQRVLDWGGISSAPKLKLLRLIGLIIVARTKPWALLTGSTR